MCRASFSLLLSLTLSTPAVAGILFVKDDGAAPLEASSPFAIREHAVQVDVEVLALAPHELHLRLPGSGSLTARRTRVERRGPDRLTWFGHLVGGEADREVVLTLHGEFVSGLIQAREGDFEIGPTAAGHQLRQIAPGAEGPCAAIQGPAPQLAPSPVSWMDGDRSPAISGVEGGTASDEAPRITLLAYYTPDARTLAGGDGAVHAVIQSGLDLLNLSLENSEIPGRVELLDARLFEPELVGGEIIEILGQLSRDPEVVETRDRLGADLVTLIITRFQERSSFCGYARVLRRQPPRSRQQQAFTVNKLSCIVPIRILAHEIGHNFGAEHDPDSTPVTPFFASFPWSFGHVVPGAFRTIMSELDCRPGPACPRIDHFSNPAVFVGGHATGIEDERDVHRTFLETLPTVAAYRSDALVVTVPTAPRELTARALSPSEVELVWVDAADNETSFRVEQAEGDGPFTRVIGFLPANTTSVTLEGLTPGTRYRFRLRAHNEAGFSAFSNVAEVTTPAELPPTPAGAAVEAVSETSVRLTWRPAPEASIHVEVASPAAGFHEVGVLAPGSFDLLIEGLEPSTPYTFRLRASGPGGFSPYGEEVSVTTEGREGSCGADGETLCLLGGRFEVRVAWRDPRSGDHDAGHALRVPGSEISGLFWFFAPENVELIVKMLDGTGLNGFFWHFYGGLSDVEYWISVRDTETGGSRTFHNPPFEICGGADTQAFAPEPGEANPAGAVAVAEAGLRTRASAGVAEDEPLRLQDRFEIEVEWTDPRSGDRGAGHPLSELGTAETGFLWFFRPENIELVVKLLDGRAVNGHFWLFWGGLSDVEYTIRVRDTVEGTETTYTNEAFQLCGGADLETL